jgi:hypothetical protein
MSMVVSNNFISCFNSCTHNDMIWFSAGMQKHCKSCTLTLNASSYHMQHLTLLTCIDACAPQLHDLLLLVPLTCRGVQPVVRVNSSHALDSMVTDSTLLQLM